MGTFRHGPSVRTERITGSHFRVISSPFPIHWATVTGGMTGTWVVTIRTAQARAVTHASFPQALQDAGIKVGALYRLDMRRKFTGPQRQAMGMGHCPAHVACRDENACEIATGHVHLCRSAPESGTVWCQEHMPDTGSP